MESLVPEALKGYLDLGLAGVTIIALIGALVWAVKGRDRIMEQFLTYVKEVAGLIPDMKSALSANVAAVQSNTTEIQQLRAELRTMAAKQEDMAREVREGFRDASRQ